MSASAPLELGADLSALPPLPVMGLVDGVIGSPGLALAVGGKELAASLGRGWFVDPASSGMELDGFACGVADGGGVAPSGFLLSGIA